ncbi:hypothetical protein, partial [Pseudarthrobacter sp. NKDBFgelt]|uniref:hypothetical protein n=1 Tax=Pseudarthrobacter sp. NKDBFgelt TaxID=3384443 RepID=UPI0038D38CF6
MRYSKAAQDPPVERNVFNASWLRLSATCVTVGTIGAFRDRAVSPAQQGSAATGFGKAERV